MTSAREVGRFRAAFAIGFLGWLAVVANWSTYLTVFLSAASVGFGLVLLVAGAFRGLETVGLAEVARRPVATALRTPAREQHRQEGNEQD